MTNGLLTFSMAVEVGSKLQIRYLRNYAFSIQQASIVLIDQWNKWQGGEIVMCDCTNYRQ